MDGTQAPQQPTIEDTEELLFTPFTILIDTAEQMPWYFRGYKRLKARIRNKQRIHFRHPLVVKTTAKHLRIGQTLYSLDYSIEGFEHRVGIERKSLSDLFGTLTEGHDRFEQKLEALADLKYEYTAVVVESSWAMVTNNNEYQEHIKSVVGSIQAFDRRYPTSWWFLPTRVEAEKWCFKQLEGLWGDRQ